MAEGLLGGLLGAGNRTRRFARGLLADPGATLADYLTMLNEEHKEANKQRYDDTQTMLYRGVMSDDPSYIAARDAAEQRSIERALDYVSGGLGTIGKATKTHGGAIKSGTAKSAKEAAGEGNLTADMLKDSATAVAMRRKFMREKLDEPFTPWKADEKGSYFDRGLIPQAMHGHPGVTQAPIQRVSPTARANLGPARVISSPENVELVKKMVQRGKSLGGKTYYPSTFPIRARYGEIGGPITFEDFVQANAATSPQAPLPINIPNATLMLHLKRRGIPQTWENARKLAEELKSKFGMGFMLSPGHVNNWDSAQKGLLSGFDSAQKITSYGENLRGNLRPYTLDTHEAQGLSMGTSAFPYYFTQKGMRPIEYGTVETNAQKVADALGIEPASMQANRWFGGGHITGLRSPAGDYLSTLEDLIKWNAEVRGWSTGRKDMQKKIDAILQGDEVLLPYWRRTPSIQYNRGLFD